MRRWDLEYKPGNYVGAGDSVLVPRNGGDWVDYDDHLAELRQTQRRMIAALYWRAGEASLLADEEHARWESAASPIDRDAACRAADRACDVLEGYRMVAEAMEAACPR